MVTYYGDARAGLTDTIRTYIVVALLSLLVITAFAAAQSGRLLAPLRTLRETADEITDTDLSRRLPETGNDDITALTRTFNRMLDRLEAAFVGQRQFLDDAGHELKTPLTVLRGHLELLDVGSPAEIAETRELLLDEIDRMSRLVGELILLAKSDRPDFVTPRPVDLDRAHRRHPGQGPRPGRPGLDPRRDRQRHGLASTSSGSPRRCSSSATTRSSTPRAGDVVALGSSYDGATGPALGPRHRPRASRPRTASRSSSGSAAAPSRTTTRGSAWASPSFAPSPARTAVRVTLEDEQPHGARFVITLPIPTVEPTDPGDRTQDETEDEEFSLWPAS